MSTKIFLVMLLLSLSATQVMAHTRSQSFSTWSVDGATLEGVYQVDAYRATQLSETPQDLVKLLSSHLNERVRALQNDRPCERVFFRPVSAPRGELRFEFKFKCPKPFLDTRAQLIVGGFFDVSISHVHYARINYLDGRTDEIVLTQGHQGVSVGATNAEASTSFVSILILGFEHVLSGVDHIAFLVALMMLAGGMRQTIWAVTGFTLGHSLTLGLVAVGLLKPDTPTVEALIGFTVAWAAGDALARHRGLPPTLGLLGAICVVLFAVVGGLSGWVHVSWLVMFGLAVFAASMSFARSINVSRVAPGIATVFGLAHGAGFAGPLLELKISPDDLVWTLLAFNIGVEGGQLVAVAAVAGLVWASRRFSMPMPAQTFDVVAALLFALGTFWFVVRSIA